MRLTDVPDSNKTTATGTVSLRVVASPDAQRVPVTTGVPLPQGWIMDVTALRLTSPEGAVCLQSRPLARWPDGSVRAVQLDFLATHLESGSAAYELSCQSKAPPGGNNAGTASPQFATVTNGAGGRQLTISPIIGEPVTVTFPFVRHNGEFIAPTFRTRSVECHGPVRSTICFEGVFPFRRGPEIRVRVSTWAGASVIRLDVRLRNPARATHRGGLWDLGDPGSLLFRSFDVAFRRAGIERPSLNIDATDNNVGPCDRIFLYQDSSGGTNWDSPNHANREGRVPCQFRGYLLKQDGNAERTGLRAQPTLFTNGRYPLSVTLPEFWQQFPKSLSANESEVRVGIFPGEWDDTHELQGGEQKSHTIWADLLGEPRSLAFARERTHTVVPPDWYAECGLFEAFPSDPTEDSESFRKLAASAIDPDRGLAARREDIDEFGWRNWGDLWADHEQAFSSAAPVISHYNNQYDVIEGCLRQFARTGDAAWWQLLAPLAQHVIDVDLYHTDQDRPAYNGGMFWHTDHYKTAFRSTHRTYSTDNSPADGSYGGGPSSSHCYSTGLLHYYYLTGDDDARTSVLQLADWLLAMEDGRQTEFGIIDNGPTGLSTLSAEAEYHGPGRGPANALNTLTDAWELTGDRRYWDQAERLLRRVVHPECNPESLNLLDVERRWFYIMFLLALARFLDSKIVAGETDATYKYGVACLRRFGKWMLANERPYFDDRDRLEYPTETWGAQDVRKANVMRRIARFCESPLREDLLAKAAGIAERGWFDLLRFNTRYTLRPLAIMLIEGLRDEFYKRGREPVAPSPGELVDCPAVCEPFREQSARVRRQLRSPAGIASAAVRLIDARRWPNFVAAVRARF